MLFFAVAFPRRQHYVPGKPRSTPLSCATPLGSDGPVDVVGQRENMDHLLKVKFKIRNHVLRHKHLSWLERPIRAGYFLFNLMRCTINRIVFWHVLLRTRKYLHLGCGEKVIAGPLMLSLVRLEQRISSTIADS